MCVIVVSGLCKSPYGMTSLFHLTRAGFVLNNIRSMSRRTMLRPSNTSLSVTTEIPLAAAGRSTRERLFPLPVAHKFPQQARPTFLAEVYFVRFESSMPHPHS